jgi:adenosylcobinamide-phosphate synthase
MLIVLLCALLLDYFFGEPKKEYHPLVMFGQFAAHLEERLNEYQLENSDNLDDVALEKQQQKNKINGLIAALVCLIPISIFIYIIHQTGTILGYLIDIAVLYFAIGLHSLKKHADTIFQQLKNKQLDNARQAVALIVSRDTEQMNEDDIARATTESILENGSDAVLAAIFWFLLAGAPGVIMYRLSNTLDAMWGYKTPRYYHFGFFIAKFDDLLNYVPARLSALSYALAGNWSNAIHCGQQQGSLWESSNAGIVMATGAGALNVKLGGADYYHGEYKQRPDLGCGEQAQAKTIKDACQLLDRATSLWVIVVALVNISIWL